MTLTKFNPLFADFTTTRERLNRLFGRHELAEAEDVTNGWDWLPAADVIENDHELTVKAELPGIEPKDVAVTIDNNVLTLKGERHIDKEVKKENYHRMERGYGTFTRAFTLPGYVDAENVKADFKNGLLTVTLPKKENARTRTVKVNAA
ncbi:MAG TPA: Hsp20/alpha crystallin family protein [Terriglobia bacterium]|nr:Hsp20/alpha crystallin family protein [Terriglobia bacterium]